MIELKKRLEILEVGYVRGHRADLYDTVGEMIRCAQRDALREFCRAVFNRAEPDGVREALIEVMRELEIKL